MGIFDKAKDALGQHPEQTDQAIDKAGDVFDEKTGGKHAEHVDKGQDMARERLGGGDQEADAAPAAEDPATPPPA